MGLGLGFGFEFLRQLGLGLGFGFEFFRQVALGLGLIGFEYFSCLTIAFNLNLIPECNPNENIILIYRLCEWKLRTMHTNRYYATRITCKMMS